METYKTDYNSLIDWINKGRDKSSRKIANNTIVRKAEHCVIVQFHNTDILNIFENAIQMFTGGYYTFTTKDRINAFLPSPFRLYQDKKVWYLWNYQTKETFVFKDGITICLSDNSVNGAKSKAELDKSNKLKLSIDKYVKEYIENLFNGKLESPSIGDCWYCSMKVNNTDKSLGDEIGDTDHLLSHMREKYYVPSMIYNAISEYKVSHVAEWTLAELLHIKDDTRIAETFGNIAKDQLTKSLRKYLYSHFSLPI